jgi:hypothetical protein
LKLMNLHNVISECLQEGYVAQIGEKRYSHKKFGCQYSHNRFLPTHRHIQKENAKMLHKSLGYEDVRHMTRCNVGMIFGFHCRKST